MRKILAVLAAMAMVQAAAAESLVGEKLDSGLGTMVYGESLDDGLGTMVYGESLDDGLGQLTALDMQRYMEKPVQMLTATESVVGEKLDSGLGTMVYGESLDSGLGTMVYGESLDSGLGELTELDMQVYMKGEQIKTASVE